MPPLTRRTVVGITALLPFACRLPLAFAQEGGAGTPDLMTPVAARYAGLASYSDSGTVETNYRWPGTPALIENHRFQTAFRAPRNFFFRFDQDPAAGGDAFVIWCDGGPFQSWWKATNVHEVHDNGQGAVAFFNGEFPTKGAATLVAPHLFPQAGLFGTTSRLIDPRDGGADTLDGRSTHRIQADSRVTGVQTVENRPIALWIDDDSGLIAQVLVEAEFGSAADFVDTKLYKLNPVANPDLPDERFSFDPEEAQ